MDRKSKFWTYVEPGDDGVTPVYVTLSEQQILDDYFLPWCELMKLARREDLISEDNCIEDWVVVHWAQPGETR